MSGSQFFSRLIGRTVHGREMVARANFDFASPPADATLLVGGQHGDEPATVRLLADFEDAFAGREPVAIVAPANPDGLAAHSRYNSRGVDLNRNFARNWSAQSVEPSGPEPWSEPEARALRDLILAIEPRKIVSLHWALAEVEADGPQSSALARTMWAALTPAQRAPYRLRLAEAAGAAQQANPICPGSLGQWCGYELRYADGSQPAMVTLELPHDPAANQRPDLLADDHLDVVRVAWAQDADAYLRAARPAVDAMLRAAITAPARLGLNRTA